MTPPPPTETRIPLHRNVKFLSWLFQAAVLLVVLSLLLWLWGNYVANTERSGIPTSYRFLDNPASFEIPGADFSSTEPVRNAYVVGLFNTIRVSAVGIILATVLGVLIGIGRLSKNWIVAKLASVYVEVVRNLPLFVIMTFTFLGVVLQALPRIEDAWEVGSLMILSSRGIGLPWYEGVSGLSLLAVLVAALVVGWAASRWRRGMSDQTGAPARAGLYGGGALLLTLVAGWALIGPTITLPEVEGRLISGGIGVDPSFFAVLIALVVYTASHIAEIVRGSIQAVPIGQGEAASALALSGAQRMTLVILPQAMRIAIPPLGNQYLNLIKNSSLGAAFAYFELTNVTQITVGNGSPSVPAFALALVFYVVLSLVTSALVNVANRRFKLVER